MKKYKSGNNNPTAEDLQFERALDEYRKVIAKLKAKAIRKYGAKAAEWFGI
jgi:hypothetical protein